MDDFRRAIREDEQKMKSAINEGLLYQLGHVYHTKKFTPNNSYIIHVYCINISLLSHNVGFKRANFPANSCLAVRVSPRSLDRVCTCRKSLQGR